jgi:hypothetical protein
VSTSDRGRLWQTRIPVGRGVVLDRLDEDDAGAGSADERRGIGNCQFCQGSAVKRKENRPYFSVHILFSGDRPSGVR